MRRAVCVHFEVFIYYFLNDRIESIVYKNGFNVCCSVTDRRCYEFLELQLKEWHTNSLERSENVANA